jgi:hypothetical protein
MSCELIAARGCELEIAGCGLDFSRKTRKAWKEEL